MKDCELVKLNLCLGCVGLAEKDWCGKEQFPEIKYIIPILNERGGMKTAYKKVESWEELK
jgi:hypothetical protein